MRLEGKGTQLPPLLPGTDAGPRDGRMGNPPRVSPPTGTTPHPSQQQPCHPIPQAAVRTPHRCPSTGKSVFAGNGPRFAANQKARTGIFTTNTETISHTRHSASAPGARGTVWAWITIAAPPARCTGRDRLKAGAASKLPDDYEVMDTGDPGGIHEFSSLARPKHFPPNPCSHNRGFSLSDSRISAFRQIDHQSKDFSVPRLCGVKPRRNVTKR